MNIASIAHRRRSLALLLILVAAGARGEDVITGTVVDVAGKPVSGAKVGTAFQLASTADKAQALLGYGPSSIVSDAAGSFSVPAAAAAYTKVLVAVGTDGTMGVIVREADKPVRIRLSRPGRLDVRLTKTFGSATPIGVTLAAGNNGAVGYASVEGGKGKYVVPQGAFVARVSNFECVSVVREFAIASRKTTKLAVTLQPTLWVRNLGKPAPELTPTDAHNWQPAPSAIASLRGKWVLLDFWATWCKPCVEEMPALIEFYAQHAAVRERFEIVAVHSPDGKSFTAIQAAYDGLVKRRWNGKELPFPLLFDSTGDTHKRWGIESYPTTLLIDPEGRIVKSATLEDLAASIGATATDPHSSSGRAH